MRAIWFSFTLVAPQRSNLLVAAMSRPPLPPMPPLISVVHETTGVLFLEKSPGVSFHADQTDEHGDAEPGVMQILREMQGRGQLEHQGRLYSVHRLDRVTSGLLMVAKSREAAQVLSQMLRDKRVCKYYVALAASKPLKKMGTIKGDMERSRRGQWMLTRGVENPAVTTFVSEALEAEGERRLRAFLLRPLTGRTHQLRVAMKALGAPVLGDPLYAKGASAGEVRAYLHAAAVRLPTGCAALAAPGENLAAVCAPSMGAEFASPAFARWFSAHFPPDIVESDCWFSQTPVQSRRTNYTAGT